MSSTDRTSTCCCRHPRGWSCPNKPPGWTPGVLPISQVSYYQDCPNVRKCCSAGCVQLWLQLCWHQKTSKSWLARWLKFWWTRRRAFAKWAGTCATCAGKSILVNLGSCTSSSAPAASSAASASQVWLAALWVPGGAHMLLDMFW